MLVSCDSACDFEQEFEEHELTEGVFSIRPSTARKILELDTLGSFDFFTLIVTLDSLDTKSIAAFHEALSVNDMSALRPIFPLIHHEYRHFIDSTSTLWGANHLNLMNEAYLSSPEMGAAETEYWKAKVFDNHISSIRYPKEYITLEKNVEPTRPWSSEIAYGLGYSTIGPSYECYCLYSHFFNRTGELLVKAPLTAVSVLEASAMCMEINMHVDMIGNMDEDDKFVEQHLYSQFATDEIHRPELIEYYLCQLTLIRFINCDNGFKVFRMCEYVCRLTLNIPKSIANKWASLDTLNKILDVAADDPLLRIVKGELKRCNVSFVFYLLCCALRDTTIHNLSDMDKSMSTALNRLETTLEEVQTDSKKAALELFEELDKSDIASIRTIADAGKFNMLKIPLTSDTPDMLELKLPPVYLGDWEKIVVFGAPMNTLQTIDIDVVYEELFAGEQWVRKFYGSMVLL